MRTFEARIKETCLRCFRADPTLIGLYSTEDDKKLEMLALERIVLIMERKPCFPRTRLISCKIVGFETSLMTLTSVNAIRRQFGRSYAFGSFTCMKLIYHLLDIFIVGLFEIFIQLTNVAQIYVRSYCGHMKGHLRRWLSFKPHCEKSCFSGYPNR